MTHPGNVRGGILAATLAAMSMTLPAVAAPEQPASAEPAVEQAASEDETITVVAPRSLPAPEKRSPYTGAPQVTMQLAIPVIYNDLDLSDPRDAQRLLTRIDRVAQDACMELDRLYPLSRDPDCVSKATANGKAAAEAVIRTASEGK